jgi:3-methyladenine DNA glycosylase AlkD
MKLCVSACPVGAIGSDGHFDFSAPPAISGGGICGCLQDSARCMLTPGFGQGRWNPALIPKQSQGGIMTAEEIVKQLKPLGSDSYKKVLLNHGIKEPFFGVKVEELKKFQKRIKMDYQLALDLYDTGIYDAMYLAGLIADDPKMTKKDLRNWIQKASCETLGEYTVPWVAAESSHGRDLALEWIDSKQERVAAAGWATLSNLVAIKNDAEFDLAELKKLLQRVQKTIHQQPNRVRHMMNGFVIALGSYVKGLTELALETAAKIGPVSVEMGGTACKVPYAPDYIQKVQKRGAIGKKRKSAKC